MSDNRHSQLSETAGIFRLRLESIANSLNTRIIICVIFALICSGVHVNLYYHVRSDAFFWIVAYELTAVGFVLSFLWLQSLSKKHKSK